MKATKAYRVQKAVKKLNFVLEILRKDYIGHFTEPSFDDIEKAFKFIEDEMNQNIKKNFGNQKKD